MADEHAEIVIIKRHGGDHEEGHHGGAWKIAFADFMTAMMALFLVLWLISATNPKMRIVIARYFNPVKLADQSAEKKGLNDPAGGGPSHASPTGETTEKHFELPPLQEKRALYDRGGMPTHDDVALFKDPYAVLSEISGQPSAGDVPKKQPAANEMAPQAPPVTDDNDETFRDPFTTIPTAQPQAVKDAPAAEHKTAEAAASAAQMDQAPKENPAPAKAEGKGEAKSEGKGETKQVSKADQANATVAQPTATQSTASQALPPAQTPPPPAAAAAAKESTTSPSKESLKIAVAAQLKAQAAEAARAGEVEAATLRKEVAGLFSKAGAASQDMPNIEVKTTDEGVLISLTDEANYAMFAIGSAEPQSKTIETMGKIAQLLKNRPGAIVVRGHTDGRAYKSGSYDNWQLSAARAQMAHYMLVRGGLDEKRIDRIEGYADHKLKVPADAMAAENRRIEILLRKDKP